MKRGIRFSGPLAPALALAIAALFSAHSSSAGQPEATPPAPTPPSSTTPKKTKPNADAKAKKKNGHAKDLWTRDYLNRLLAKLSDERYAVRQGASTLLLTAPPRWLPELIKAGARAEDPERKKRINDAAIFWPWRFDER